MKGSGSKSYVKYTQPIYEGGKPYGKSGKMDDCKSLAFNTILTNQQPTFSKIKIGAFMSVILKGTAIEVVDTTGALCGLVTSRHNARLIDCIIKGNSYKAQLLNILGEVRITIE